MMSNTFILVDEALLSRLKEFVIKEISLSLSLTHTLQDQLASTRPKTMGIQHVGLLRKTGSSLWSSVGDVVSSLQMS